MWIYYNKYCMYLYLCINAMYYIFIQYLLYTHYFKLYIIYKFLKKTFINVIFIY